MINFKGIALQNFVNTLSMRTARKKRWWLFWLM